MNYSSLTHDELISMAARDAATPLELALIGAVESVLQELSETYESERDRVIARLDRILSICNEYDLEELPEESPLVEIANIAEGD